MPDVDTDTTQIEKFAILAQKHGVGTETVRQLYDALKAGGGYQAQFSIPELGGMGQWSSGGMLMIGDMFNHGLKAKVADLCAELSVIAQEDAAARPSLSQTQHQGDGSSRSYDSWYPAALGMPSTSGSQNAMRYAFFPSTRRLAINDGASTTVYDTADHQISGVSQQQGNGRDLAFSSQHGAVEISSLKKVGDPNDGASGTKASPAPPVAQPPEQSQAGSRHPGDHDDIIGKIERLAALREKGILSEDEFRAKKAELLARL